jgi:branched-chain amino acid transport system ATP-binding protein
MLRLDDVHTHYGRSHVLKGLSIAVDKGECVALLGRNSVGKSTTLKTILGLVPATSGRIRFGDTDLVGMPPHRVPCLGIGYVPQHDNVFGQLTVLDNLNIGMVKTGRRELSLERVFDLFPKLKTRLSQPAGSLSGGERQMVAIGRALIGDPGLILFDEPTAGLSPALAHEFGGIVRRIADEGVAVLMVEQNVRIALDHCGRFYVLERGTVRYDGAVGSIDDATLFRYLGL